MITGLVLSLSGYLGWTIPFVIEDGGIFFCIEVTWKMFKTTLVWSVPDELVVQTKENSLKQRICFSWDHQYIEQANEK